MNWNKECRFGIEMFVWEFWEDFLMKYKLKFLG